MPRIAAARLGMVTAGVIAAGALAAACGSGGSSASTATSTATASGGFGRANRTPRPAVETALAEGTRFPFRDRTPLPAVQTARAEGTVVRPLGGGPGGLGGIGQMLSTVASLLAMTDAQLQAALQAPGATIASVAAARGQQRAAFHRALIDAITRRLDQAAAAGTITRVQATQFESNFAANIDRFLDNPGGFGAPPPAATPTP